MSTVSSKAFLPSLHLIRGLCAVAIASYHYMAWRYDFVIGSMGTFGVYTFFTLSAVVLLRQHQEEFSQAVNKASLLNFYRLRFARVSPLLVSVAVISMVLAQFRNGIPISETWPKTFLSASGLMALHMPGLIGTTAGAWSLGIEIGFYTVFPIMVLLLAGASIRRLSVVVLFALFAQYALLISLPDSHAPDFWGQYTMPLTFAPFFIIGFLIHAMPRRSSQMYLLFSIIALGMLFSFSLVSSANVYRGGAVYLLLTLLSSASVYFALNAKMPEAMTKPSRFLGDISYSLYLTNWYAYELCKGLPKGPMAIAVFALVSLAIAVFAWHFIEKPLRRALSPKPKASQILTSAHS